jgi:hypothetical protein
VICKLKPAANQMNSKYFTNLMLISRGQGSKCNERLERWR